MMNKPHNKSRMAKSHDANDLQDAQSTLNEQQLLLINDLADGQLQGDVFANAMSLLNNSNDARDVWHRLHVVGDVMRSNELANCHSDSAFLQRMKLSLQQEPAIQAVSASTLQTTHVKTSANDSVFIWKSVAGLASLVGVVAVSWSLLNGAINGGTGSGAELASTPTQTNQAPLAVVASDTAVAGVGSGAASGRGEMLRDAQLDAMIAAHKQLGGYSALQAPSGFLRHATFDKNRP